MIDAEELEVVAGLIADVDIGIAAEDADLAVARVHHVGIDIDAAAADLELVDLDGLGGLAEEDVVVAIELGGLLQEDPVGLAVAVLGDIPRHGIPEHQVIVLVAALDDAADIEIAGLDDDLVREDGAAGALDRVPALVDVLLRIGRQGQDLLHLAGGCGAQVRRVLGIVRIAVGALGDVGPDRARLAADVVGADPIDIDGTAGDHGDVGGADVVFDSDVAGGLQGDVGARCIDAAAAVVVAQDVDARLGGGAVEQQIALGGLDSDLGLVLGLIRHAAEAGLEDRRGAHGHIAQLIVLLRGLLVGCLDVGVARDHHAVQVQPADGRRYGNALDVQEQGRLVDDGHIRIAGRDPVSGAADLIGAQVDDAGLGMDGLDGDRGHLLLIAGDHAVGGVRVQQPELGEHTLQARDLLLVEGGQGLVAGIEQQVLLGPLQVLDQVALQHLGVGGEADIAHQLVVRDLPGDRVDVVDDQALLAVLAGAHLAVHLDGAGAVRARDALGHGAGARRQRRLQRRRPAMALTGGSDQVVGKPRRVQPGLAGGGEHRELLDLDRVVLLHLGGGLDVLDGDQRVRIGVGAGLDLVAVGIEIGVRPRGQQQLAIGGELGGLADQDGVGLGDVHMGLGTDRAGQTVGLAAVGDLDVAAAAGGGGDAPGAVDLGVVADGDVGAVLQCLEGDVGAGAGDGADGLEGDLLVAVDAVGRREVDQVRVARDPGHRQLRALADGHIGVEDQRGVAVDAAASAQGVGAAVDILARHQVLLHPVVGTDEDAVGLDDLMVAHRGLDRGIDSVVHLAAGPGQGPAAGGLELAVEPGEMIGADDQAAVAAAEHDLAGAGAGVDAGGQHAGGVGAGDRRGAGVGAPRARLGAGQVAVGRLGDDAEVAGVDTGAPTQPGLGLGVALGVRLGGTGRDDAERVAVGVRVLAGLVAGLDQDVVHVQGGAVGDQGVDGAVGGGAGQGGIDTEQITAGSAGGLGADSVAAARHHMVRADAEAVGSEVAADGRGDPRGQLAGGLGDADRGTARDGKAQGLGMELGRGLGRDVHIRGAQRGPLDARRDRRRRVDLGHGAIGGGGDSAEARGDREHLGQQVAAVEGVDVHIA